jgi:flagellum-specific ATP synthase
MRYTTTLERAAAGRAGLRDIAPLQIEGRVSGLSGLVVDIDGLSGHVCVGDRLLLVARGGHDIPAEIVGFRQGLAQAMPFGALDGLGPGSAARFQPQSVGEPTGGTLSVSDAWLGRVLDPLGRPLDGHGALPAGRTARRVRAPPPDATLRARLGPRLDVGVRALNCFATCRRGQRLGLFSGSGIGKSTLLAMLARHTECDVAVLALVGERGREVREFLEDDLGSAGLARSVVVVATSDSPPLLRRQAAFAAMTVAEHFRDQGKSVLLLMDSVTRFCLALREIGLSAGEPPATRGYPPSVFAELPRLLERAGPGLDGPDGLVGHVTALFNVLVEGDDHNEPVADAVRGILDGHIVLDRRIAEGGRYPAIDVLRSLSRAVPGCNAPEENALARRARALLALHADMADMVRLGAYRRQRWCCGRGGSAGPAHRDDAATGARRTHRYRRQLRAAARGDGAAMSRDPLEALLRLRRMAADEARRGLAECLRAEGEAAAAVATIEAAIDRETEAATSLAAGDAEVEAFAAWLRRIRPKQQAALAAAESAEAATTQARGVLGAARAGVQAAEETLEKRGAVERAEAERKAQNEIDEAAQRGGVVTKT